MTKEIKRLELESEKRIKSQEKVNAELQAQKYSELAKKMEKEAVLLAQQQIKSVIDKENSERPFRNL